MAERASIVKAAIAAVDQSCAYPVCYPSFSSIIKIKAD
jgi:hypothetical protein